MLHIHGSINVDFNKKNMSIKLFEDYTHGPVLGQSYSSAPNKIRTTSSRITAVAFYKYIRFQPNPTTIQLFTSAGLPRNHVKVSSKGELNGKIE